MSKIKFLIKIDQNHPFFNQKQFLHFKTGKNDLPRSNLSFYG